MKTTLLLIAVAILCAGCNEEALKAQIGELKAENTALQDKNVALKADNNKLAGQVASLRPSGPEASGLAAATALPFEFLAALLFVFLVWVTMRAIFRQMAQLDPQQGTLISWIMVLAGFVATVAASIVSPYWAGPPYTPFLRFATIARPTTGWASLLVILLSTAVFFGIAYFLLRLCGSAILKKRKWGCSLIILGLVFFGSHYRLACLSVIWTFGAATGYLIYPLSIGEAFGALLGTGAYLIANPGFKLWESATQANLTPEPGTVKWTDNEQEEISTFLAKCLEFAFRVFGSRH